MDQRGRKALGAVVAALAAVVVLSVAAMLPMTGASASERVPINKSCQTTKTLVIGNLLGDLACTVTFTCPEGATSCFVQAKIRVQGVGLFGGFMDFTADGGFASHYSSGPNPAVLSIESFSPDATSIGAGQTATARCFAGGYVSVGTKLTCSLLGEYFAT